MGSVVHSTDPNCAKKPSSTFIGMAQLLFHATEKRIADREVGVIGKKPSFLRSQSPEE